MAQEWRYYKDPDYGDWVQITVGTNPERLWLDCSPNIDPSELKPGLDKADRIPPPKNASLANWFNGKHWRQEPARQWSVDREGMHVLKGLLLGAPVSIAFITDFGIWLMLALSTILYVRFLVYEITEDWRIFDRSYRDFLGEMFGFMGLVLPSAVYWLWKYGGAFGWIG